MYTGPHLIKDNLVFGYDTGYGIADNNTDTRFYTGKNTVNHLSSGVSNYNVVQGAAWHGATPTFTLGTSEFGTPIGTYTVGSTSYMYSYDQVLDDDLSTLSGQTVTFSIYLKRQGTPTTVGIRIYDNVSGYTTVYAAATNTFQRFTMSKTLGTNPTRIFVMIDNTNGGIIDFHSPQLEIGVASPFVDGSRSSTQSLIDLKRTTDIDVSNVSFDSTGQPEFDGTNDAIQLPTSLVGNLSTAELTVEAVVYHTAWGGASSSRPYIANWNTWNPTTPNQRGFILRTFTTEQFPRFWYCWGASYANVPSSTSMSLNQFHHVVGVFKKDSYAKIYLDGVETGTTTSGTGNHLVYDDTTGTRIGYGTINTGRFVGELPIIKIYNQALSAQEVKQNYNAYKSRFNI